MAPKRRPPGATESAAEVVARQMPDWQLVPEVESDVVLDEAAMKVDQGPSIAKLRRKFGVSDSGTGEPDLAPVDPSVETVRIAPKSGGPAKTADIKNGKIKIVQG